MTQTTTSTKKPVTRDEFDKKIDIARAHFEYFDRLSTTEARIKAVEEVNSEYFVQVKKTTT